MANATPSVVEMTYNMTLASITPSTATFTVMVNGASRAVSSVTISGTKVLLTLTSPIVYGNSVTVAYTKPTSNPLQATGGGLAVNLSAQPVTNNVLAVIPVYSGAVVANATPSVIEMTYSITLASVIPAASAFAVKVMRIILYQRKIMRYCHFL